MVMLSVLAFCRIVIGLVFGYSFLRKVMSIPTFEQTITQFRILPKRFSRAAALLFLAGEFAVALLVTVGGPFLEPGFFLSIFLLLLFCSALVSVLHRDIQTSCNCFGSTKKPVAALEVWRDAGFIICASIGSGVLIRSNNGQGHLSLAEWSLIGFGAVIFLVLWLHLDEIVQLFQPG